MFKLSPSDHNRRCIVTMNTGHVEEVESMIIYHGGVPYLLSNCPYLEGDRLTNRHGYKYSFALSNDGRDLMGSPRYMGFRFVEENVLMKKDNSGNLFRRVYKIDGKMIFVGSIQKDVEDCKKPSSIITPMDYSYLQSKGWSPYEQEPSAEKKAELASKSPKPV